MNKRIEKGKVIRLPKDKVFAVLVRMSNESSYIKIFHELNEACDYLYEVVNTSCHEAFLYQGIEGTNVFDLVV